MCLYGWQKICDTKVQCKESQSVDETFGLRMYRYNDENPQIPAQRDVKGGEDFVAFQPFLVFNMKLEGFPIRCKDL